ncbi:MAG: hypothetical protein ACI30J_08935 [Paludibacteraceae bacterium]
MKTTELMINDFVHVYRHLGYVQVSGISENSIITKYGEEVDVSRLKPIRLNHNLLLRIGFECKTKDVCYTLEFEHGESIEVLRHTLGSGKYLYLSNNARGDIDFLYVHELQNLIRVLQGGKEIEL